MMNRRAATALAIDVIAVLIFVVIGRRNHNETGSAVSATVAVAGPFLIGLAVGWLATRAARAPLALRTGAGIWACTVVVGLILRRFAFDRGVAIAFIIVAALTLGLFLLGWRAIAAQVSRPTRE